MADTYDNNGNTIASAGNLYSYDFENRLTALKEDMERDRVQNVVPRLAAEYEDGLAWVDLFEDAFLAARIDDAEGIIELGARIRTDLK